MLRLLFLVATQVPLLVPGVTSAVTTILRSVGLRWLCLVLLVILSQVLLVVLSLPLRLVVVLLRIVELERVLGDTGCMIERGVFIEQLLT